jgi:hypothetical protein
MPKNSGRDEKGAIRGPRQATKERFERGLVGKQILFDNGARGRVHDNFALLDLFALAHFKLAIRQEIGHHAGMIGGW